MPTHKYASINGTNIPEMLAQAQHLSEMGYSLITAYAVQETVENARSVTRHFYIFEKTAPEN